MENTAVENYEDKKAKFSKEIDKLFVRLFDEEVFFENHFYDPVSLLINQTLNIKEGDRSITKR